VDRRTRLGTELIVILILAFICSQSPALAQSQKSSSSAQTAGGPLPERAVPGGFQSFNNPRGSGRLIYTKVSGDKNSARAVMRGSLAALKSYFDGPTQLLSAVSDPQDQAVQVMLSASLQGQRVRGVAFAVVAQGGAAFGLIFDRPELLPSSFQTLSARLGQEIPAGQRGSGAIDLTSPREWKRQTAGDRSAAVDLPPGWQITGCSQGIVTIAGPHNELIQLGLIFFVSTLPGSQGMAGPYLQPVPAFSFFVNYFTRVNLQQGTNLNNVPGRVLEIKEVPAPMQNGRGAYLLQEVSTNGKPSKVFALVYTAPNLLTGWTLYTSFVAAPADLFPGEFADMMRIWSSWKVDDRVYQRQMQQTLESMNATREILSNGTERQMHAYDNLEESMDLILKGEERVENKSLGGRADVNTQNTDAILHACQVRGYECQRVPFDELTKP
jgi:hypothetical protein